MNLRPGVGVLVAAVAMAGALTLTGCTTRTELRTDEPPPAQFTDRWARAEITRLPPESHYVFRRELHDEEDLLLFDPPGTRRTGYVMRYETTLRLEQVVDYYLRRFGERWTFDTRTLDRRARLTAVRGELAAEIRLAHLVRSPEERELIPFNTQVDVIVSDRTDP